MLDASPGRAKRIVLVVLAAVLSACGTDASNDAVHTSSATGASTAGSGGSGQAGNVGSGGSTSTIASTTSSTSTTSSGSGGAAGAADAGDAGGAGGMGGNADSAAPADVARDSAALPDAVPDSAAPADSAPDVPRPNEDAKRGDDSSLPPGADLKIMTFNIRYANPADGANAWPNRRDMVYRLLRRQDPDTAGLQEALYTQIQDLEAALPDYGRIGVGRDDGKTAGEFSAIFYRKSRFDVVESGTFWFSDTPDVAGSSTWGNASIRICTWGRFVEKGTGHSYYQFNVHLDNVSEPANEKSVQLLMKRVIARQVQTDPFVVTGDFNSGESDPPAKYMIGAAAIGGMTNPIPLVDSFRQLYPNATGVGTFHNFMGGTAGDKIDFIFMAPGERAITAEIDRTQENGRYPSDHYPVAAAIDILGW